MSKLTCIDLFCGCGGFTLGMQRAGFHCLAAIDFNSVADLYWGEAFPRGPSLLSYPAGTAFSDALGCEVILDNY